MTEEGQILQDEPPGAGGAGGAKISATSIPPSILHPTVLPKQAECLMSVCAAQQRHGRVWRRLMSRTQEEEWRRREERGVAAGASGLPFHPRVPKYNHQNHDLTEIQI